MGGRSEALGTLGMGRPLGKHTLEGASTSSPQHCSGDTEEEDARAAAATVVAERRSTAFLRAAGPYTVVPPHLVTITSTSSSHELIRAMRVSERPVITSTADDDDAAHYLTNKTVHQRQEFRRKPVTNLGQFCSLSLECAADYDRLRKSSREQLSGADLSTKSCLTN